VPHGPLPLLMDRTPYGVAGANDKINGALKELAEDGYIFAFADIRGRYLSEGQFVMQRALCPEGAPHACIDEGTDTFDTIDWLEKNVPNHNGRVGMIGVSYDGWLAILAAVHPHPALKAVSPQAPPADMFLGDDFHHNGAFRLSYGFEYAARMERSKEQTPFAFDRYDTFQWYLALGPLSNMGRYMPDTLPTWNDFVEHPNYDKFWIDQAVWHRLGEPQLPTLLVSGWWDQEDFYGPNKIYETFEPHDRQRRNFLVVGPWNHGGWNRADGNTLGSIDFGSPTALDFRRNIQAPWFARFLKDRGTDLLPKAVTFQAGANRWQTWDQWPPTSRTTDRLLYTAPDGRLSFTAPGSSGKRLFDEYVSDPAHPVPYRRPPIPPTYYAGGSGWPTWLVEDQRFLDGRPDVLTWETEPLTEDLDFAGRVTAHLFASTSGSDSDWIVKLIDVYPDTLQGAMAGYQLMVSNEVLRARYRSSFEKPEAVLSNAVVPYTIDLHTQNYRFARGHRMMVHVQSTWFPLIDRNPQTFVPNIFKAVASDFRAATQRIYRSARYPSHLTIPVVRAAEGTRNPAAGEDSEPR
jgi:hypothetical protein